MAGQYISEKPFKVTSVFKTLPHRLSPVLLSRYYQFIAIIIHLIILMVFSLGWITNSSPKVAINKEKYSTDRFAASAVSWWNLESWSYRNWNTYVFDFLKHLSILLFLISIFLSLVCEVTYKSASGDQLTASRYYKFQVQKPLDVKTKFYNAEVCFSGIFGFIVKQQLTVHLWNSLY